MLNVENPATNETYATLEMMEREEVLYVIEKARAAFNGWRFSPVGERVELVHGFIRKLIEQKEAVATEVTKQMGKPLAQARREVDGCIRRASFMASIAEESLKDIALESSGELFKKIVLEPKGVLVDIASWNYPLQVAVSVIAPAVLAGNAVVVKHSSYTPFCGLMFERLFRAAGAPEGLVSAVVADRANSAALFESPLVKGIFFTGSVDGGYQVNRQAARLLVDVGLELGGKDPAYVRADADLADCVPILADASFYNTGQSCCAVERIYVHKSCYDDFVAGFFKEVKGYKVGDPMVEGAYIGPMTQKKQLGVLEAQTEEALVLGAKCILGGKRTSVNGKGNYFEPTILIDVTNNMLAMQEESFGPIIGIMPVSNDEEAVSLMNDSRFGLSASVWTRDYKTAMKLAPMIEAGTVLLNRADAVDPDLAWTGVKESGKGCTLSELGFKAMTQPKSYNFRLV